jgi:hypothetical protein
MGLNRRHFKSIVVSPDDQFVFCGTSTGDVVQVCEMNRER